MIWPVPMHRGHTPVWMNCPRMVRRTVRTWPAAAAVGTGLDGGGVGGAGALALGADRLGGEG